MVSHKMKEVFCLFYATIYFISGLILIGLPIYLLIKLFSYYEVIPSSSVGPFFVLCVLGLIHLFATWIGIKGPSREHNFHIVMFMALIMVLLIMEFAVGVWSMVLWDEVEISIIDLMTVSFNKFLTENSNKRLWDKMQYNLNCCGLKNSDDYTVVGVPLSCFIDHSIDSNSTSVFDVGCKLPVIRYTKKILIQGAAIGFVLTLFQALGFYLYYNFFTSLRVIRADRINRRVEFQRELASLQPEHPPLQRQSYMPVATDPNNTSNNTTGGGGAGETSLNTSSASNRAEGDSRATQIRSTNAETPPVSTAA